MSTACRIDNQAVLESSSHSDHTGLRNLARLIVAASKQELTAVLVSAGKLQFAADFYVELCQAIHQQSGCHVRLEMLPGFRIGSLWTSQSRAVQRLQEVLPPGCSVIRPWRSHATCNR